MIADRAWQIVRMVELGAPAREMRQVVGEFYTIHTCHPNIELMETPEDQDAQSTLGRILTFPGQPRTTEGGCIEHTSSTVSFSDLESINELDFVAASSRLNMEAFKSPSNLPAKMANACSVIIGIRRLASPTT